MQKPKQPCQIVEQQWNKMTPFYTKFDDLPQTFHYTLCNMLQLCSSKNILQIGCGAGRNLPYAIQVKNPEAQYFATDISPQMVKNAEIRLRKNFQRYQSKITYEQWCQKQKIFIEAANGEKPYSKKNIKFDRIICNLVLMLTPNPENMIKSMFEVAEQGCLLGLTIWGDKSKNNLLSCVDKAMVQFGYPQQQGKFYLFKKIEGMLEKNGWQIVFNWEQNGVFGILELDENNEDMQKFLYISLQFVKDPEIKQKIKARVKQMHKQILASKVPFIFSGQLVIARKKSTK